MNEIRTVNGATVEVFDPAKPFFDTVPEHVTLPTTRVKVPTEAAALTLTNLQSMNTMNGQTFSAVVKDGRTVLGTIEQDGHGGGTWFRPTSREAGERWEHLSRQFHDVALAAGDDVNVWLYNESFPDVLADEALTTREFNRKRSPIWKETIDAEDPMGFRGKVTVEQAKAHLAKHKPESVIWVKGTGWTPVA
jgi:hypothetical protein